MTDPVSASGDELVDSTAARTVDRNFTIRWLGQAVNVLGSQITIVALPLLAVHALDAGPAHQIGLLHACTSAAFVLMGLPAGPLVDRVAKRRLLVVTNVLSALLLGTIVLVSYQGVLAQFHLYIAALALGMCGVVAGVAFISIVPDVVPGSHLVNATGRLSVVRTSAQVIGPAAAGFLVGVVGPANAVLFDALSFLVATVSIVLLRIIAATDTVPRADEAKPARESISASAAGGKP